MIEAKPTIATLVARYREQQTNPKEKNTRYTENIHLAHLERLLGKETLLAAITKEKLQEYVDVRLKEDGLRGRTVSEVTVRKEIATLSAIWNKVAVPSLITYPPPTRDLDYGKERGKLPFQTIEQASRQAGQPGLTKVRRDSYSLDPRLGDGERRSCEAGQVAPCLLQGGCHPIRPRR